MFRSLKVVVAAATLAIAALSADAATVISTGTFAGTTDFTTSGAGPIVSSFNPAYLPDDASSEWVWDADLIASPITFTVGFDLSGYQISTASLSGLWGADNEGSAYLNGVLISTIVFGYDAFEKLTAYTGAGAAFNSGMNYLTFVVQNDFPPFDPAFNPAAFRATVNVTAAEVPLPAGLPLLGGAIGLLGFGAARRRRNTLN